MSFNLHLSLSDFLLSFETYTVRDVISVKLRMHVPTFTSFSLSLFFFYIFLMVYLFWVFGEMRILYWVYGIFSIGLIYVNVGFVGKICNFLKVRMQLQL